MPNSQPTDLPERSRCCAHTGEKVPAGQKKMQKPCQTTQEREWEAVILQEQLG